MTLKILSWNIWIDGRFDKVTDFLQGSNADIIGLQEVQDDDPKRDIIGFLDGLGYQHIFAPVKKIWGKEVWNDGPAIFSRYDILKNQIYPLSKIDNRTAVRADIRVKDKTIHVLNTHLIHTHQRESKIQKEQIKNLIKNLTRERVIVMGDFNATPESSTIKIMQKKLIDSDLLSNPTWSVYPEGCITCKPQDINVRLDYIFTSKDVPIKSFQVENSRGSDHLPVSALVEV